MAGRHYVFLVHGTWGYEDSSKKKPWYATNSEFTSQLNKLLSEGSEVAADWQVRSFTWLECDNKHEHRIKAGRKLAAQIIKLRRSDPDSKIHFVAHSHGGNVVLEALSLWFLRLRSRGYLAFSSSLEQMAKDRPKLDETFTTAPTQDELKPRLIRAFRASALFKRVRPEIVEKLSGLPASSPVSPGWRDFLRDLDIGVFNAIDRGFTRRRVWSEAAADLWAADPSIHGVGHLVFLGTPFYQKTWKCNRSGLGRAWEKIRRLSLVMLGLLLYATVLGLLVYVFVMSVAAIFVGWNWNPAKWPPLIVLLAVFFGVIPWLAALPKVPRAMRAQAYHDTNVYFDWGYESLRRVSHSIEKRCRIPCLVVSAGLLDEALLGLSAQPVVEGAFRPQLREWLGLVANKTGDTRQYRPIAVSDTGIDWNVDRGFIVVGLSKRVLGLILFFPWQAAKGLWRSLLGPISEAQTLGIVRRVAEMIATGLPAQVVRRATVQVGLNIGVNEVFKQYSWNVTELSFSVVPFQMVQREAERFTFLLPDRELPDVDETRHFIYEALKRRERSQERHVHNRQLLKTALVIDERVAEAKRAVGLVHSTYYADEAMIRAVAQFLLTGQPPEGATLSSFPEIV